MILKESDNPWIWNGVVDALKAAGISLEIDRVEPDVSADMFTVHVYFKMTRDVLPPRPRKETEQSVWMRVENSPCAHICYQEPGWKVLKTTFL